MIVFLIVYILGICAFFIHLNKIPKEERSWQRIVELSLLYQIVFNVGITSFIAFAGLDFWSSMADEYTKWPTSPYEQELANVNLAFGVLSIIAIWLRGPFWTAIIIGFSIWILGDAIHHFYDAVVHHNHSLANEGALVYTDLFIPIILCITLPFYPAGWKQQR